MSILVCSRELSSEFFWEGRGVEGEEREVLG